MSLFDTAAAAMVALGIATLVAALAPLSRIICHLGAGRTRSTWYLLGALTLLFIAGYAAYLALALGTHAHSMALVVPAVFLFGACFVWLTFSLALRTVLDVRRIALLEQESITDELTGVYNRRYLQRRLAEEFARARRHGHPLAVLLLDVDHFKHVNDGHGHRAGDIALRELGALCLNAVRATDIVARYGGEELVVIAPDTPAPAALALAERLRRQVQTQRLEIEVAPHQRRTLQLTVSVGVATLEAATADPLALLAAADGAMYRAKSDGRNCVRASSGLAAPATCALAG